MRLGMLPTYSRQLDVHLQGVRGRSEVGGKEQGVRQQIYHKGAGGRRHEVNLELTLCRPGERQEERTNRSSNLSQVVKDVRP